MSVPNGQMELERLATNLRVEDELLRVLKLLEPWSPVVFKGPLLTRMIYRDLRLRASADNDIWIPEPDVTAALERLLDSGYSALPHLNPRAALRRVGQVALFHPDPSVPSLDLHAEPFSKRFFTVSNSTLVRHLHLVPFHGRQVRIFDEPLAFTHLVAHYIQHHFDEHLLVDLRGAWRAWSTSRATLYAIAKLSGSTCTRAALALTLNMCGLDEEMRSLPWRGLSAWDRVRVEWVARRLRSSVKSPTALERQFLALFLVAPHRLAQGVAGAVLLEQDELVSRYGPGRREVLLLRHLWSKLSG